MKKSFMTRILATGLSLAMAFSMAAATNVTTASAASKPAMITSAGASAKSLSLKVGEVTKIKVNAATKANYKVSAVKASSTRVRAAVVGSTVVAIRGLKATVEGKPSTVKVSFKSRKTNKTSKFTYSSKVTVIEDKLTVTGVSATDATTLTVTGTKLGDLTAADIKVTPTIAVASYTAAADGKTAVVKLAAGLQSNTEYTIAVNGSEFKVKYTTGEITSVAVVENAYDNDTPGQQLAITVNGGTPITVHDLLSDGYFVEFSVTSNGSAYDGFFKTATNKSLDGVLTDGAIVERSYQVQVVLTKGSSIITSPVATVKVINLDATANSFESYVLSGSYETTSTNVGYSISNVKLTGKTLVAGEEVVLTDAAIMTADGKVKLPASVLSKVDITSDNKNVIQVATVDGSKGLKAIAPGTATVTFSYGTVKTTATYTVVNANRYPASAYAKTTTLRAIANGDKVSTTVVVKDQYGEFVQGLTFSNAANGAKIYTIYPSVATAAAAAGATSEKGEANVDVQGFGAGETPLTFAYIDNNLNKASNTSANIIVTNSMDAVATNNKLVVASGSQSSDLTLDKYVQAKDQKVKIQLNTYTAYDALVSAGANIAVNDYFKYNAATVTLAAAESNFRQEPDTILGYNRATCVNQANDITIEAAAKGTTDLVLFDGTNNEEKARIQITVVDTTPYVTAVSFNANCPEVIKYQNEKLNYTNIFNTTASAGDPVITGITVAQPYAQLRFGLSGDAKGKIYIDAASDGAYQSAEDTLIAKVVVEGETTLKADSTATYTLPATGTARDITYKVVCEFSGTPDKVIAAKVVRVEK